MVANFMKVGIFSICLGIVVGCAITYVMKRSTSLFKTPMYETFFVILGAYLSYALAHLNFFQLSGDVAIFFYGVIMSHYNKYNMGKESFRNVGMTFNLMMQAAEAICFIYIGLSFPDAIGNHYENFIYVGIVIGSLFVCRAFVISIVGLMKRNNDRFRVFKGEWMAILFAGMIKGPMAYIFMDVLVPDRNPCINVNDPVQYKKAFPLFVMQICVVISLLVIHPMNYLVFKLSVDEILHEGEDIEHKTKRESNVKAKLLLSEDWTVDRDRPRVFQYIDEFLLKPMLIRSYFKRRQEIKKLKAEYDELVSMYDHGAHLEHEAHHKAHHAHGHHHGHDNDDHHAHADIPEDYADDNDSHSFDLDDKKEVDMFEGRYTNVDLEILHSGKMST